MKDAALIDAVIEQMKLDIDSQDWTALAELLGHTPEDALVAFLSDCGMPEGGQS
jgi:acid phosphatase family membrane protein YuiD